MDDLSLLYRALGLPDGASAEEVKLAYRDLVKVWHPDRFEHDERLRLVAQDKLKEINGAYKMLQAHFFEASISPGAEAPPVAEREAPPSAESPVRRRNRAMLWVALGVLGLVAAAAAWFLEQGHGDANKAANVSPGGSARTNGCSLSFDANNSYVTLATTGSLAGTFTVECWVLSKRPKVGGTILCSRGPDDYSFDLKLRQAKRFHADIGDGHQWLSKMANATFSYNHDLWYHIAYVVTPTNYTVYIDGRRWAHAALSLPGNPLLYDATHQLSLGIDLLEPSEFIGCIDEVRIWSTARTAEEIKANESEVLTGNETGLQGLWQFDEGTGKTTADGSGHGFTGTLTGKISWSASTPFSGR